MGESANIKDKLDCYYRNITAFFTAKHLPPITLEDMKPSEST